MGISAAQLRSSIYKKLPYDTRIHPNLAHAVTEVWYNEDDGRSYDWLLQKVRVTISNIIRKAPKGYKRIYKYKVSGKYYKLTTEWSKYRVIKDQRAAYDQLFQQLQLFYNKTIENKKQGLLILNKSNDLLTEARKLLR